MYVCMCVRMYVCVCVRMYVCMCVCVRVCMYLIVRTPRQTQHSRSMLPNHFTDPPVIGLLKMTHRHTLCTAGDSEFVACCCCCVCACVCVCVMCVCVCVCVM